MRTASVRNAPIGNFIVERTDRLRDDQATIYSVTNDRGFVPSLELFDKQVFSADTGSYKKVGHQDIAFNPSRINVGSIALLDDKAGGAVSPMYTVVRCKPGLRPAYLLNFLRSEVGQMEIRRRCEGAVRFMLKYNDLCRIEIPLPGPEEQDRLVALLDEADALRKLRVQAEARTTQLIPAIFQEMFGDRKDLPIRSVGDLSSFITSGSRGWAKYYTNVGPSFIRVQNLTGHRLSLNDIACVKPPPSAETERTRVKLGDVLLAITGNTIGLCALVDSDIGESYVNQHVSIIRPTKEIIPEYLQLYLSMPHGGQQQIAEKQAGQTKPGLTLGQVKGLRVPVPSITAQRELATRVKEVRGLQAAQGQARAKVEALWGSLLGEVFG